ncbi:MAG TPA: sensor domain-containing protein, partial [Humibacillus sp.]|nr:sensor domain-containing protein [Humibacillus sp.]
MTTSTRTERYLAPRHTAYVVLGGVVAALAAGLVWALIGLGAGLLVIGVGVVFIGLLLVVSEGLSRWHRARAAALLGVVVVAPVEPTEPGWRGWLARLGRATTWRQLAYHAVVSPTLLAASAALVAFCWGGGLVLVTSPLWARITPEVLALPGGL